MDTPLPARKKRRGPSHLAPCSEAHPTTPTKPAPRHQNHTPDRNTTNKCEKETLYVKENQPSQHDTHASEIHPTKPLNTELSLSKQSARGFYGWSKLTRGYSYTVIVIVCIASLHLLYLIRRSTRSRLGFANVLTRSLVAGVGHAVLALSYPLPRASYSLCAVRGSRFAVRGVRSSVTHVTSTPIHLTSL